MMWIQKLQDDNERSIYIRAVIAFLVRNIKNLTFRELANSIGRKESALCQAARRLEIKMNSSEDLKIEIDKLKTDFFESIKVI